MADPLPINNGPGPVKRTTGPSGGAAKPGSSSASGPAFRALLERLEEHAQGLKQASESIEKPEELAGAVDRARSSLSDALSLKDELLEAYRAAQVRAETGEKEG